MYDDNRINPHALYDIQSEIAIAEFERGVLTSMIMFVRYWLGGGFPDISNQIRDYYDSMR